MSNPNQELIFSVWKFLNEERYEKTAHMLERESECYFDMRYFEEMVIIGNWDEAENYFSSFTKFDDNSHSNEIFLLIRKCKFIEALDRKDRAKAAEILKKDLKTFNNRNENFFKEMVELWKLDDIWKHGSLSKYEKFENVRKRTVLQLHNTIVKNPLLIDKLKYPSNTSQRLQCLFNQRLESGHCFDMGYFEEMMLSGNWDEAEKYISGFTKIGDNIYSNNIVLLIRKCKFLKALDRKDHVKATEILVNDLIMFKHINEDFFTEMVQLLKLDNIWKHESISEYGDFESLRKNTVLRLKNIIEANPLFIGKLKSPSIASKSNLHDSGSRKISETVRKDTYQKDVEDLKWKSLLLTTHVLGYDIFGLTYTNEGDAILSLAPIYHLLWQWPGQANTMDLPCVSLPEDVLLMNNEYGGINHEEVPPSFALNRTDSYLYSASGGSVSVFDMKTFKLVDSIMPPPPAATCIAFYPQDDNTVAIGMSDSSIIIYNHHSKRVKAKLRGHTGRVTGLAFSKTLNMLISSCIDAKILAWNVKEWKNTKKASPRLKTKSHIHIQFHQDQRHFLLVHIDCLAIYKASTLKCVKMWNTKVDASISSAAFSCDSQIVYASLFRGDIIIFDGSKLEPRTNILCTEYITRYRPFGYTLVIAAHPKKPYQFAVGLSNSDVYVIEAEGFEPPKAPSNPPKRELIDYLPLASKYSKLKGPMVE